MVKKITSSESGATILLALLFFLMCAVAGSVVLAAGSASSGRVAGLAEQEQTFYTVSSSAGIMRDELSNRTLTMGNGEDTYSLSPDSELEDLVTKAVGSVSENGEAYNDTLEISLSKGDFAKVTCAFVMNADYSMILTLNRNGDEKDTYLCSIRIPVSSVVSSGPSGAAPDIKWGEGTISKGR